MSWRESEGVSLSRRRARVPGTHDGSDAVRRAQLDSKHTPGARLHTGGGSRARRAVGRGRLPWLRTGLHGEVVKPPNILYELQV